MDEDKLSANQYVIVAFLCGLSYGVLLALDAGRTSINAFIAPLREIPLSWIYAWPFELLSVPGFRSPMFWVMPLFGFFLLFFAMGWVKKNIETKYSVNIVYPIMLLFFVFLSLMAFYLAVYWYVANFAAMQGVEMTPELVDFWGKLHGNAYLLFFWGGIFGWISRFVVEKLNF